MSDDSTIYQEINEEQKLAFEAIKKIAEKAVKIPMQLELKLLVMIAFEPKLSDYEVRRTIFRLITGDIYLDNELELVKAYEKMVTGKLN